MKEGLSNVSTLIMNEETNTLFVGGRDAVFALDLSNISREIMQSTTLCKFYFYFQIKCQNYILCLCKINYFNLYVCGTNTYYPTCDHMANISFFFLMSLHFKNKYSSLFLLTGGEFYSLNGKKCFVYLCVSEPSFVNMEIVHESESNPNGHNDKMYVFFTETAVEFEFYDKLLVSRIARICRGDLGGKRILQRRWISFLKSRLSFSIPELNFHFDIVQDIFLLRRRKFYGIFSQQCKDSHFSMNSLSTNIPLLMVYRGEVPVPHPGACTDNLAQSVGYNASFDLPDKVLQFVRDHPLMDNSVNPVGNRPVLLPTIQRFQLYRIVVDRVTGLDKHTVLSLEYISFYVDDGYLHKAFSCDGEMFIVEELQLFLSPEPEQSLRLSSEKVELLSLTPSCTPRECSTSGPCLEWCRSQCPCATGPRTAQIASWHSIPAAPGPSLLRNVFCWQIKPLRLQ
uniref:Sema domain-containing protein n=1 Tax=Athene cunicularia TaxID=194338 RepID=A0A663N198_ATHCN